ERPADGSGAAVADDPPAEVPPSGCRRSDGWRPDGPLPDAAEPPAAPALPGDGLTDDGPADDGPVDAAPSALDPPAEPAAAPSCERFDAPMLSPAVEIRIGVVMDSPASGRLPAGRTEPVSASA